MFTKFTAIVLALVVSTVALAGDVDHEAQILATHPAQAQAYIEGHARKEDAIGQLRAANQPVPAADLAEEEHEAAVLAKLAELQSQPAPAAPAQQTAPAVAPPPSPVVVPCASYSEVNGHFNASFGADAVFAGHRCWSKADPDSMQIVNASDGWYAIEIDEAPVLLWQRSATQPVLIPVDRRAAELEGVLPAGMVSLIPPGGVVYLKTPSSGTIKAGLYTGDPAFGLKFRCKKEDAIVEGNSYEIYTLDGRCY